MEATMSEYTGVSTLAGLVAVIHGGAIYAAPHARRWVNVPVEQTADPSIGVKMIALLVVESLVLIALWRVWSRRSDRFKRLVKNALFFGLIVVYLTVGHIAGQLWSMTAFLCLGLAVVGLDKVLERFDLDWLTFNGFAIAAGIGMTALAGNLIAPIAMIPFLVLAMVWDYVAVILSGLMGHLVDLSASAGIPNFIVIPDGWRVDFEAVTEYVSDLEATEKPDGVAGIIGLGDFALPGILAVSAWVAGATIPATATILGTVVAMVILRNSLQAADGGLPALPWLNTGALVGFLTGIAVTGMPLAEALGVAG
jgi:presenilin-like A22 family membrane protease